jgi:ribosomal protein S18 acetylase RimI-like enzyme
VITSHGNESLLDHWDPLAEAYLDVFAGPPWNEDGSDLQPFRDRLTAAIRQPGFRALLAWDGGAVEAFALGWVRQPPFPAGRAYGRIRQRLGDAAVEQVLLGAFEVDELGVRPRARGRGLGRHLLTALTADAPEGRAWLVTSADATDALAFYRAAGWHEAPAAADPGDGGRRVAVFLSPTHAGVPAPGG